MNVIFDKNSDVAQNKKCYRNKEAAKFLGVSPKTLNNWRCTSNDGPRYSKAPGRNGIIIYTRECLQEWLDNNSRTSTSSIKKGNGHV